MAHSDDEDNQPDSESQQTSSEPLARTRTRRSNAGARMHEMIFAAEDNEAIAQALGISKNDDESSDDEEYIPRELESSRAAGHHTKAANGGSGNDSNDDDDDAASNSDGDSNDSSDESSDSDSDEDEDEDEDEEEEGEEAGREHEDETGAELKVEQQLFKQERAKELDSGAAPKGQRSSPKEAKFASLLKKQPAETHTSSSSPSKAAYEACRRICSVCLGDQSDEDDEMIECDACGVAVHEGCYGVSGETASSTNEDGVGDGDNDQDDAHQQKQERCVNAAGDHVSVHSNISSESTEPWFCEPCKRSVIDPYCEICPNKGGIFKQTDTGRWIHMVCALYTRGVTFENIDDLTEVSLFDVNYAQFGSKSCTICEDRRLARSGICIGCDAGLCKTFFHPTCAQKEGLLFESHSDEVDPYFAQCKQHADKAIIKTKKRSYAAMHARLKRIQPLQHCSDRIKDKLAELRQIPDEHLTKWTPDNRPPIPIQTSRLLMTSPSLIIRLTRKAELLGLDPKSAFMSVQDEMEMARQKWHVPPAFSLEFVAYCRDRATRMANMKKQNTELINQNNTLKRDEASLREKFNSIKELVSQLRSENEALIKEARAFQKMVTTLNGKPYNLPLQMEQLMSRYSNSKGKSHIKSSKVSNKSSSTYGCGKCNTVKDQHLLALCDTCHAYFHIYCLDPPLTRVPKKTKVAGWQCSDCAERDEEEQEEAIEEQNIQAVQELDNPRRLRERIKFPEKYCHESMMMADFWSVQKKRPKKGLAKGSKSNKKAKIES